MSAKRENVISKKDAYMTIAMIMSQRSKDPNTQVGAVIVSDSDRILSIGYNGFPNGCSDDEFPWDREADSEYDTKYPYVCHSELNAILNFRGDNTALIGASLYVTLFPCHECAKAIIQSGIKTIYYFNDKYKDTIDNKESCRMFDSAGVKYYHLDPDLSKLKTLIGDGVEEDSLKITNNDGFHQDFIRYCSKCDNPIDLSHNNRPKFCSNCGAKIKA